MKTTRRAGAISDAAAMRKLGEGDLAALGALYDAHHEHVRNFLRRVTGRSADADDLAHDVFIVASQIAESFDGRASARPFLIGIAAQLARRRRHRFARYAAMLGEIGRALFPGQAPPDDALAAREDLAAFEEALARLSEEKRLVFLLVTRESFSSEEVASLLDIPVGTVWTRLHHARAELRERLRKQGVL